MKIRLVIIFVIMVLFSITSCSTKTIKIGFVGDVSSKKSQLAVDMRNATEYAVDEVNAKGGIDGRMLELVVKDDNNDIDTALSTHTAFVDEGVQFVIGHITSNMTQAVKERSGDKLLFVSPSMSADSLTGIDDYFLRTSPINSNQAITIAEQLKKDHVTSLTIVYDMMNAEYSENLYNKVKKISKDYGFEVTAGIAFDMRVDNQQDIAQQILDTKNDHVFFISQATDTAFFMQYIKQRSTELVGYSVSWSMTQDLIQNGGKNVQDMLFVGLYKPEIDSQEYKGFVEKFESVYGYEPSFACVLSYDAMRVLIAGLEKSENLSTTEVKKAILQIQTFDGLQESFDMDSYGDNNRSYLMYRLSGETFAPEWP